MEAKKLVKEGRVDNAKILAYLPIAVPRARLAPVPKNAQF
jgi:hypothetical protein